MRNAYAPSWESGNPDAAAWGGGQETGGQKFGFTISDSFCVDLRRVQWSNAQPSHEMLFASVASFFLEEMLSRKRETEARLATASNETCKQKRKGWMYEKHENYVKNDQMSWRFVNIFVKNLQKTWILSEIWILHFRILRVSRLKAWSCRNSSSGRCANRRAMLSRWAACFHMPTYKLICQYDIKMLTSLKGEK